MIYPEQNKALAFGGLTADDRMVVVDGFRVTPEEAKKAESEDKARRAAPNKARTGSQNKAVTSGDGSAGPTAG